MLVLNPASKSISSLSSINLGKHNLLQEYFDEAKNIKNLVSKTIHQNLLINIYNSDLAFERDLYKTISSEYLGKWELQTLTKEIIEHKKEQVNRFVFKYSPKILVEKKITKRGIKNIYKKGTKSQKAISFALIYFYGLRYNLNLYKNTKDKKKLFEIMVKNKQKFEIIKSQFSEFKWSKILKITKIIFSNLNKKLKLGEYSSGAHYKMGQVTKSPLLMIDESNSKYKIFYELKTNKGNIHIPMAYNEKYHQKLKFFLESSPVKGKKRKDIVKLKESKCPESLIQRQHMISLSERTKRLIIGLSYQKEYQMLEENKFIGIDVGARSHNHLATKLGLTAFTFSEEIAEKLKALDERHKLEGENTKLRFDVRKLFREILDLRMKEIKEFLTSLKDQGFTDIIMERIGQFNYTRGKNHDTDLKSSRYREQLLNLGGLENEFRIIAHNLGMRIHSIPSYYTSKYCHHCNSIHDDNRSNEKFLCINCGSSGNADIHAAENIEYIFERFSKILCKFSSFSESIANTYLTKDKIKEILTQKH